MLALNELPEPGGVEPVVPITSATCGLGSLKLSSASDGRLVDPVAGRGLGQDVSGRLLALNDHDCFVAVSARVMGT